VGERFVRFTERQAHEVVISWARHIAHATSIFSTLSPAGLSE
jgi:hypothetical protein